MSIYMKPRKSQQRKALLTWYGDKNNMLGTKWIHKRQRPEVFGFAKGLILGLKKDWKSPFVTVQFWSSTERVDFIVSSENQLSPVIIRRESTG